jgi:hypothetical protein
MQGDERPDEPMFSYITAAQRSAARFTGRAAALSKSRAA